MEKLIISTGVKLYQVNENGAVFRFAPADSGMYARFLHLIDVVEDVTRELDKAYKNANFEDGPDADNEGVKAFAAEFENADKRIKAELSKTFGEQLNNDFDAIFDGVNAFSVTETGESVITNFLNAIQPIIEAGVSDHAKKKAKEQAAAISKAKAKRSQK